MPEDKFSVGDRVQRRVDVMNSTSNYRQGTIISRYQDNSKFQNPKLYYPELYQVEWDDGVVEKGFLPHGLEPLKMTEAQYMRENDKSRKY